MVSLLYVTNRKVELPFRELGLTYYGICLAISLNFAINGLYWSKAYQVECPIESSYYIKAKGSLKEVFWYNYRNVDPSFVWSFVSASDFVSDVDDGGIVIQTDIGVTKNQAQNKYCAESPSVKEAICKTDSDCKEGVQFDNGVATGKCVESTILPGKYCETDSDCKKGEELGYGVATGECVDSFYPHFKFCKTDSACEGVKFENADIPAEKYNIIASPRVKTCEIKQTWCPVGPVCRTEYDQVINQVENFTVEVRNSVSFSKCGSFHGDNLQSLSNDYLLTCLYHPEKHPSCPNFRFGDIFNASGYNFKNVRKTGGLFQLQINWHCDFDWGRTVKDCLPKYKFSRIDNVTHSPGFIFDRKVLYNFTDEATITDTRTIVHYFGIKISIDVIGNGKKFSAFKFISEIGSFAGFLGIATFVCDNLFKLGCKSKIKKIFGLRYEKDMVYKSATRNTSSGTGYTTFGTNEETQNMRTDANEMGTLAS